MIYNYLKITTENTNTWIYQINYYNYKKFYGCLYASSTTPLFSAHPKWAVFLHIPSFPKFGSFSVTFTTAAISFIISSFIHQPSASLN